MNLCSVPHHVLEHTLPFLDLLRQMYAVIDASVEQTIKKAAQPLACGVGCSHCCAQPIPVTLLEVMGIKTYLRHQCPQDSLQQLRHAPPRPVCALLDAHGKCAVYPCRPIACRRYLIGTRPCAEGENPVHTRPSHVLEPDRKALLYALRLSAPFYVDSKLLDAPPQTMQDFSKVTVLLASIDWQAEIAVGLQRCSAGT